MQYTYNTTYKSCTLPEVEQWYSTIMKSEQTSQINPDRQVKSNRTKIDKLKKDRRHIHQDY